MQWRSPYILTPIAAKLWWSDQKKFLDGKNSTDLLNQHAKFDGDRMSHAGAREKVRVSFVYLLRLPRPLDSRWWMVRWFSDRVCRSDVRPWPWPWGKVLGRPWHKSSRPLIWLIPVFFLPNETNFLSLSLLSVSELVVASNAVLNNRGHVLTIHVRILFWPWPWPWPC